MRGHTDQTELSCVDVGDRAPLPGHPGEDPEADRGRSDAAGPGHQEHAPIAPRGAGRPLRRLGLREQGSQAFECHGGQMVDHLLPGHPAGVQVKVDRTRVHPLGVRDGLIGPLDRPAAVVDPFAERGGVGAQVPEEDPFPVRPGQKAGEMAGAVDETGDQQQSCPRLLISRGEGGQPRGDQLGLLGGHTYGQTYLVGVHEGRGHTPFRHGLQHPVAGRGLSHARRPRQPHHRHHAVTLGGGSAAPPPVFPILARRRSHQGYPQAEADRARIIGCLGSGETGHVSAPLRPGGPL